MDIEIGTFFKVLFFVFGVISAGRYVWFGIKQELKEQRLGRMAIDVAEKELEAR